MKRSSVSSSLAVAAAAVCLTTAALATAMTTTTTTTASAGSATGHSGSGPLAPNDIISQSSLRRRRHRHGRRRHMQEEQGEDAADNDLATTTTTTSDELSAAANDEDNDHHHPIASHRLDNTNHPGDHNYNGGASACPNHPSSLVVGYSSLALLRRDLDAYFASFEPRPPTSAPTSSEMPTPFTREPTAKPTVDPTPHPSESPTENPTRKPSELPTKAPVTLRPTFDPTGAMFLGGGRKNAPTTSPGPTIEIVIHGGGGEGGLSTYPGGPGPGQGGGGDDNMVGVMQQPGAMPQGNNDGDDAAGTIMPGTMIRKRTRGHVAAGRTLRRRRRRLLDQSANVDEEAPDVVTSPDGPADVAFSRSPPHTGSDLSPADPVSFLLCPDVDFDFANDDPEAGSSSLPPLTIRTPLEHHPMEIRCLGNNNGEEDEGSGCVFRGGGIHLSIDHHHDFDDEANEDEEGHAGPTMMDGHPLSISGITFRDADSASVRMRDPRGNVSFQNCNWENNSGDATFVVDGTYDHTRPPTVRPTSSAPTAGPSMTCEPECTTTSSTLDMNILSAETTTMASDPFAMGTPVASEANEDADGEDEEGGARRRRALDAAEYEVEVEDPGAIFDTWGRRERELMRADEHGEDAMTSTMTTIEDERGTMTRRGRTSVVGDVPRSIVSIERCSFAGNKGSATIMVSSFWDELSLDEQDPGVLNHNDDLFTGDMPNRDLESKPLAHSVHLSIRETTFSSEEVDAAVIVNSGGRLQSSDVVFANNTAESIIRSEESTVSMVATEFSDNDVRGDEGVVVLDAASAVELTEGTCVGHRSGAATLGGGGEQPASVSAQGAVYVNRQAGIVAEEDVATTAAAVAPIAATRSSRCEGIVSGGFCESFDDCADLAAADVAIAGGTPPTVDEDQPPAVDEVRPTAEEMDPSPPAKDADRCFSNWEDLVVAVRDRPPDRRVFVVCSNAELLATDDPVVIRDATDVSVQCGEDDESPSATCEVSGGFSHFHVLGSSSGVRISRMRMTGSTGSSVMALGSPAGVAATFSLSLVDCSWTGNRGASAVVVHGDEALHEAKSGGTLDLLSTEWSGSGGGDAAAPTVEVSRCRFEDNELSFGAVANVGGTLSVAETIFSNNGGRAGDVVVTRNGTCTLHDSCFDSSASVTPGVVFLERGSEMIAHEGNFGVGVTAGGYAGGDGTCTAVFMEAEGSDCMGSTGCDGTCDEFAATACALDSQGPGGNNATTDEGASAAAPKDEGVRPRAPGSSSVLPIVIATVVTAVVVFGILGFLYKRKKSKKPSATDIEDVEARPPGRFSLPSFPKIPKIPKRKEKARAADVIDPEEELFDNDQEMND